MSEKIRAFFHLQFGDAISGLTMAETYYLIIAGAFIVLVLFWLSID